MGLRPLGYILGAALSVGVAMAADGDSQKPAATDTQNGMAVGSDEARNLVTDAFNYALFQVPSQKNTAKLTPRSRGIPLANDRDVCFTMRTYKVKPKERFADGEEADAGYSTCQMASGFRVHSADGDAAVRLK
jgi:hypothetical protein